MFVINREIGVGPGHNVSACRALQQKILHRQHLLDHKAPLVGPNTGYLHCKKTLRDQEAFLSFFFFFEGEVLLPIFLKGKIQERMIG